MRILVVASRYLPHRGGLETVVRELSRQWQQKGHDVTIVTSRYPRTLPGREIIDDILVRRLHFIYPQLRHLKSRRVDLWLAGWVLFPFTLLQLLVMFLCKEPDVVNLHYLGSPGLFLWILHHVLRFPLIVSLHGGDVDGEPYRSRFNRWLFSAVLRRASAVTACSQNLLNQVLDLEPDIQSKAHVIHNGVDIDRFSNAAPYKHPKPYILGVGQLVPHKGFDLLIRAFVKATTDYSNVDLIIAGEGPQRPVLENQIASRGLNNRIHLLGAVGHTKIASLMCSSLCIVIPSRREPFGIVAVEAMASGRKIVASKVGGLTEALKEAEVIWVPPDNVLVLTEVLTDLCQNYAPKNQLSQHNREIAECYAWSIVADHYIDILEARRWVV